MATFVIGYLLRAAKLYSTLLVIFVVILLALLLSDAIWRRAHAHDYKHPDYDSWYRSLERPGVSAYSGGITSCCSLTDCHETEAEMRGDDWWARLGKRVRNEENGEYDWELQDWVKVPSGVVLQHATNPTGNPVICHSMDLEDGGTHVSPRSTVFCFIPAGEV